MATRARCPPERFPIFCCRSASENCSIARNRATLFFVAVNASESGYAFTAWPTVSVRSSSAYTWLYDTKRAPFAQRTVPASGDVTPVSTSSRVDLPDPFGPITATRSPRCRSNESPSNTGAPPNDFDSPVTVSRSFDTFSPS